MIFKILRTDNLPPPQLLATGEILKTCFELINVLLTQSSFFLLEKREKKKKKK